MKNKLTVRETVLFAMYGAIMYVSKIIMQGLPNIHLLTMFIVLFTVVYRIKALIPTYIYVFAEGIFGGFSIWWVPYLYIWAIPCLITLLIPKKTPKKLLIIIYPIICAVHGFLYGTLYAPFQAIAFGLNLKQTLTWIAAGFSFDAIHGISNFCLGFLVFPLSEALKKAEKYSV